MKYYYCEICGNVEYADEAPKCCGQEMTLLDTNKQSGAPEKHKPVVTVNGNVVDVKLGEVDHPMEEAHSIKFIGVRTDKGLKVTTLKPGDAPKAEFNIGDAKFIEAVALCNLHGFWVA